MKLIYCPDCHDVIRLMEFHRKCHCGASGGMYQDRINAIIDGKAIPIGFDNRSFVYALQGRPEEGDGTVFIAFVIPKKCKTVEIY